MHTEIEGMKMSRKGRRRLAVDIPISMHDKIKELARMRNCTMTIWIMRALTIKIKSEYQNGAFLQKDTNDDKT